MSAFDIIIFLTLLFLTIIFALTYFLSNDTLAFLRSFNFILIIIGYIVTITAYIVITQIVERMYE